MYEEDLYEEDELEEEAEMGENGFVCEDCDYRWEEFTNAEMDPGSIICPMCGSINVTQL